MKFGTEFVMFCGDVLDLVQKELGIEGLSLAQRQMPEAEI